LNSNTTNYYFLTLIFMNYIKQLQLIILLLCAIVVLSLVTGIAFIASYSPGSENLAQQSNSSAQPGMPAATQVAEITDPEAKAGEGLFKNNCAACHATSGEVVVGPGLAGITQRRPDAWLIPWIKNSQKVIQSGDKYAVEIYNKFNKTVMPSYDFSDEQIKSILKYINAVNGSGAVAQQ
jgi:mono/diheme cytochrome c family protein